MAVYFMNQVSDLEETYDHKTEEWLDQEYMAGYQYLAVFESPQETSEKLQDMDNRLTDKDKEMTTMKETIEEMKAQILELRLEKLETLNGLKKKK